MTKSHSQLTPHHSLRPVWVVRHVPHEGLGTIADALERSRVPWITIDAFAGRAAAIRSEKRLPGSS